MHVRSTFARIKTRSSYYDDGFSEYKLKMEERKRGLTENEISTEIVRCIIMACINPNPSVHRLQATHTAYTLWVYKK